MMIFYQKQNNNFWIYNPDGITIREKIFVLSKSVEVKGILSAMLDVGEFLYTYGQLVAIEDKPEEFFLEYIPRVMGFKSDVKKVKDMDALNELTKDFY
jgi:hypothetical protein